MYRETNTFGIKIFLPFLMFASVLFADRDGGPYLGAGYGTSSFDDDSLYSEVKKDISQTAVFYAGAYINKHLSVELGHVRFNPLNLDDGYEVVNSSNAIQSISFSATSINTLAHYAFFDDILDFYAKFGVGEMDVRGAKRTGFDKLYGVGTAIRFNKHISVKLAYDMHNFEYIDTADSSKYNMKIHNIYSAMEVQF